MYARRVPLLVALVLALAGCTANRGGGDPARSYDLGIAIPPGLPDVHIGSVRAVPPFDTLDMHYRLAYRNPAELLAYAQSRWAAPLGELLRKRLSRASSGAGRCTLNLELHEASQVFRTRDTSEALLEIQAVLVGGQRRIGERSLRVIESDAGAGGPDGAAAITRAVDRAIRDLANWIATQAACHSDTAKAG